MKKTEDMDLSEKIDYYLNYLLVKIGEGKFREGINLMIQDISNIAYGAGLKEGLKRKKNGK